MMDSAAAHRLSPQRPLRPRTRVCRRPRIIRCRLSTKYRGEDVDDDALEAVHSSRRKHAWHGLLLSTLFLIVSVYPRHLIGVYGFLLLMPSARQSRGSGPSRQPGLLSRTLRTRPLPPSLLPLKVTRNNSSPPPSLSSSMPNEEFTSSSSPASSSFPRNNNNRLEEKRKMELMWCSKDYCKDVIRERVVGQHNHILLNGPATGQVAYFWNDEQDAQNIKSTVYNNNPGLPRSPDLFNGEYIPQNMRPATATARADPAVLLLIKPGDDSLLEIAAQSIQEWLAQDRIQVLLDPSTLARLEPHLAAALGPPPVDNHTPQDVGGRRRLHAFEARPTPGFGDDLAPIACDVDGSDDAQQTDFWSEEHDPTKTKDALDMEEGPTLDEIMINPDLICTLGGDGLLMYAAMMFQGPSPPILCIAGGSLGFLTPFRPDEMVEAVRMALGLVAPETYPRPEASSDANEKMTGPNANAPDFVQDIDVFPPNMPTYPYSPLLSAAESEAEQKAGRFKFGKGGRICLSIRMRLECQILDKDGQVRSRYNVLNEVVIDRGNSPYLAALECFVDDVHLTTVQADGVIFATPTGSTAYSLAAGSSVVHPAVPCILVTPICPHVLSFRPMVFPDHVTLCCFIPSDARADAYVAFDGKHRQELVRGESVTVQMSPYPVPTINRVDHSSDWLGSLKRNFNFNARPRQRPL